MFKDSLKRLQVPAELTALINDTTGTLIASNYVDPNTKIAVIFGTGCNAAYMETAENIPKMNDVGLPPKQGMAINVGVPSPGIGGADDSVNGEHSTLSSTSTCVCWLA
jgi:hexokinase